MRGATWAKPAMYLAGAMAIYAWRSRQQPGNDGDRAMRPPDGHAPDGDDGSLEDEASWDLRDAPNGHAATGITNLPPPSENAQQSSLPPRGTRKHDA